MTTFYKSALILLHGSGGDGNNLYEYIDKLHPTFFNNLEESKIKVVLPTAKLIPYSLTGKETRAWFDRKSIAYDSIEDTEGLNNTHCEIKKIITDLWNNYGIDSSRIIIGGFSMGGSTALHFTISELYDFPAVISIGSYISTKSKIWSKNENMAVSYKINPKIVMIHGDEDLLIRPELSEKTRDMLIEKKYDVDWFIQKGVKHEISRDSLDYILKFVIDTFETAF